MPKSLSNAPLVPTGTWPENADFESNPPSLPIGEGGKGQRNGQRLTNLARWRSSSASHNSRRYACYTINLADRSKC
ncbi:hypothetical protein E2562_038512 [Oryza meyeriana var. granulata]|uniref:Uncharacterized protein n=1 Tax=Oryza meyeriana var. granulata TaxID=110450 RepID=A0A6G1EU91_9ORYZ|nr:hypothetical protein E2562_038512 [Oryza meyeriana var. granulata]